MAAQFITDLDVMVYYPYKSKLLTTSQNAIVTACFPKIITHIFSQ